MNHHREALNVLDTKINELQTMVRMHNQSIDSQQDKRAKLIKRIHDLEYSKRLLEDSQ